MEAPDTVAAQRAEHILRLFPEINLIQDEDLRGKVVRAWVKAWEYGGWERIEQAPLVIKAVKKEEAGVEHIRTVAKMARALAEIIRDFSQVPINMDYVLAGALLHDVGKALEYAPEGAAPLAGEMLRHPISGAFIALEVGLPLEMAHIIATHSVEGTYVSQTLEATLVSFADYASFDVLARRELGKTFKDFMPKVYLPSAGSPHRG